MGKKVVKGIIFDCWGTLFYDDYEMHPFKEFCIALGKDLDKDYDFMKMFEKSFMLDKFDGSRAPVSDMLKKLKIEPSEANIRRYMEIIDKVGKHHVEYPDVLSCLSDYKKEYKLAMITNTYSVSFEILRKQFDLDNLFDCIITSYESHHLKPDGTLFTQAIKSLGLKADEVVMVGDSIKDDFIAAKELCIKSILIDRRKRYPMITPRIESLDELKAYLR